MLFPQSELGRLECRAAQLRPKDQRLVWATLAWPDQPFQRKFFSGGYPPEKSGGNQCKQPTKCNRSVYHVLNQECIRCPDCTCASVVSYLLSVIRGNGVSGRRREAPDRVKASLTRPMEGIPRRKIDYAVNRKPGYGSVVRRCTSTYEPSAMKAETGFALSGSTNFSP